MIDILRWRQSLAATDLVVTELAVYLEHGSLYMMVTGPGAGRREAMIVDCEGGAFSLDVDGVTVISYLHREGMLVVLDRLERVVLRTPAAEPITRDAVERALAVR